MKRYPVHPGHQGGETSKEAADALSPYLNRLQKLVLDAIIAAGNRGLTRQEGSDLLGDPASIEPRFSELKSDDLKLTADSGQRRRNRSGKRAIVWVAVDRRDGSEARLP